MATLFLSNTTAFLHKKKKKKKKTLTHVLKMFFQTMDQSPSLFYFVGPKVQGVNTMEFWFWYIIFTASIAHHAIDILIFEPRFQLFFFFKNNYLQNNLNVVEHD